MIEFIRLFAELVSRALPRIGLYREDRRRREMAVDLFLIYVRLNEAMITAEKIVGHLEWYANSDDSDDSLVWLPSLLAQSMSRQSDNLKRLRILLSERSAVLLIIDRNIYLRLQSLISGKTDSLKMLLESMRCGVPLGVSPYDSSEMGALTGGLVHQEEHGQGLSMDIPSIQFSSFSDPQMRIRVQSYLQSQTPRDRLSQIHASLNLLRTALEDNFSIQDVILDVGSRPTDF